MSKQIQMKVGRSLILKLKPFGKECMKLNLGVPRRLIQCYNKIVLQHKLKD